MKIGMDIDNRIPIQPARNRKEKKAYEKVLGKKFKTKEELNAVINMFNAISGVDMSDQPKFKECLLEGDKVKLNVDSIKCHPSWDKYDPEYRRFVEDNEGVVFTVKYDENKRDNPNMVCLLEDTSEMQWLFWEGSLLVQDERDDKFKPIYMIVEDDGERVDTN